MSVRQQKAVAAFPFGIIRTNLHGVAPGDGKHVGKAQRLTDIALPLDFAHAQSKAANPVCVVRDLSVGVGGRVGGRPR